MHSAPSTQNAMAHLAICLESVRDAVLPVTDALAGISRDEAVELAEHAEQIARSLYLLQLHLARAVEESAPALTSSSSLGTDTTRDGDPAVECPGTSSDATPSPYRRGSDLLRVRLRISGREARQRIRTAALVLPRQSLTGEGLGPLHPVLHCHLTDSPLATSTADDDAILRATAPDALGGGVAQGSTIGAEAVAVILKTLDKARQVAASATLQEIEHTLAVYAETFDPDVLSKLGARILTHLDPDGAEPTDRELRSRQGVRVGASWKGLTHLDIWADSLQTETLLTVFDAATNPRPGGESDASPGAPLSASNDNADGSTVPEGVFDDRTRSQVMLDALVSACSTALRVGGLRDVGGLPPQVMVTMNYADLVAGLGEVGVNWAEPRATERGASEVRDADVRAGLAPGVLDHRPRSLAGSARLPHAGPVPVRRLRHLACDADLIPIVLGSTGQVLDLGRTKRLVTPTLRRALIARDGGCIFPGCALPATWTEAHHLLHWSDGGRTSLDNLVLLCSHHHHAIHTRRWQITGPAHRPTITPVWAQMPGLTRQIA